MRGEELKVSLTSIILPVKNEPEIARFVDDLSKCLSGYDFEIIVVSGDKKLPVLSPPIKVVKSYADSLERAILLGFSVAKGNKIIVMDSDYSHPIYVVPNMIHELDNYEMVIGSRFIYSKCYKTTFFRHIVSFIFNYIASLLGSTLTDPMTGFFGVQTSILNEVKFKPYKWKIALEISNKLHPTTKEISYYFKNREVGKSKSNWKIGLKILFDLVTDKI